MKRFFQFNGRRIIKTGLAVFLTAIICEWFGWPPVFAVITAIVTIEPTVSDSIKKGLVRFPASAIGSAFAVFFITLFGNAPITYALAAVATIAVCYRLNLHAGLLVATLTSVAMVEVIHDHVVISFFIRLGTTTVGLLVSTAVNMLVLPPDYRRDILKNIQQISDRAGTMLEQTFRETLFDGDASRKGEQLVVKELITDIRKTETLIRFQRDDATLYPWVRERETVLLMAEKQLLFLHNLEFHVDALLRVPRHEIKWTAAEREIIMDAVTGLADDLQYATPYNHDKHQRQLERITDLFWKNTRSITTSNTARPAEFPPEFTILYELITIYDLVDKFFDPDSVRVDGTAKE
ncbi:aromatic acid exporter family protein [Planomicrobium sp. YIM 101495]|uniref:aromatic acid exporter family protein n=1 Tax=Planomicrobium sp. YIM 101495 TaxID=2665160 RepID=UPI0012B707F2|nr:aromatic acid exporter family protein [Planomicrobium sp. YIM 101495]MTD31903.1 aromatic acid exporter family protein [Planomicrobium sp. YIM 101495]